MRYHLVPLTRDAARAFVDAVHRHLPSPLGEVIRVGVAADGVLVGVAVAGRPVARHLDDGATLEVVRVAVMDGHPNACSRLYGAIARAATALGWSRLVTYTRADEPGSSPAAAGFVRDALLPAREGWTNRGGSRAVEARGPQVRWVRSLTQGRIFRHRKTPDSGVED